MSPLTFYLGVGNVVAHGLHDTLVESGVPDPARLALQLEDVQVRVVLEDRLRLRATEIGVLADAEPRLVVHPDQIVIHRRGGNVFSLAELGRVAVDRPFGSHKRRPVRVIIRRLVTFGNRHKRSRGVWIVDLSNRPVAFDVNHEVGKRRILGNRHHLVDLVFALVEDVDAGGDHLVGGRVRRHERWWQKVLQMSSLAISV